MPSPTHVKPSFALFLISIIIIVLVFAVIASSAERESEVTRSEVARKVEATFKESLQNDISYFKDERTNICFAHMRTYSGRGLALATVPCSEEVEAIITPNE